MNQNTDYVPIATNYNQTWFEKFRKTPEYKKMTTRPIAYFCAEYGMEDKSLLFAGGLGILAGDVIKEAADQKLPMLAIGLYYHQGNICEEKDFNQKTCLDLPKNLDGLKPVTDIGNKPIIIKVPIQDRDILVQAWEKNINGIRLFLLDADLEENTPNDRLITNRLYPNDKEIRLKQSIVIGIGGLRLLEAIQIHPSIYHINEGHSAMLILELIHHQMKERHISFDEAKQFARRRMVFTNHTLLPAGNEIFSDDLVALMLTRYAEILGVPVSELVKLGLVQESRVFSMTMMSLRMSGIINAVSKLQAKKAREIWADHPMVSITNGIHIRTWDIIKTDSDKVGDLWAAHLKRKKELLDLIKVRTGREWSTHQLLIGWARRIVSYKRPMALIEDLKKFRSVAEDSIRPIRVVMAGRPHPGDDEGLRMLQEITSLSQGELKDTLVYLPHYDLEMAKLLVAGCDVWVNTPIVGFEACGTSGMKAALNGALSLTTKDGWIDEVEISDKGWLVNNDDVTHDLLEILEKQIAPMYYDLDSNGIPTQWEKKMRNSRKMILDDFSTTRMVREYIEMLYS